MAEELTGVVQSVEYTHGGAGNQYTTIDGVRYVTYWDIRTRNWTEGDRVRFTAVMRSLWENSPKRLFAENISKIEPESLKEVPADEGVASGVPA